jgi:acyl-CoA thioester hydrolase
VTGFSVTITPRFYETDALGHINNASITAWFEVARVSYLESIWDKDPSAAKNWILASLQLDFLAETLYGTDVIADIIDARVGNSSLTVICAMSQEGRVRCVEALCWCIWTMRPSPQSAFRTSCGSV